MKKNKYWERAKKSILGGNMLISKRPEFILPDYWPSYYSRSKKINVWDVKNRKFNDFFFGVGTNILGYANTDIDNTVNKAIKLGNMSSLNSFDEVLLAEKLIEMHPWADKVKFARSGGEANAIAIRIARAATSKSTIAICGYHGWHDWYLAANLKSNSLDEHIISGLDPKGVPKELKNTIKTFFYNDIEGLKRIISNNKIAAVKMEVSRTSEPNINFLKEVRKICTKNNIILIFDECTSGFRDHYGGLHLKYNIDPDMTMLGKALGNGYPITAILGKDNIMMKSIDSFISSTFWTEKLGPVAAIKTLELMEKYKTWEDISKKGKYIKKKWSQIFNSLDLDMTISGLNAIPSFSFNENNNIKLSYLIYLMLNKGYLSSNILFLSFYHKNKDISNYLDCFYDSLNEIRNTSIKKINKVLSKSIRVSSFERLN